MGVRATIMPPVATGIESAKIPLGAPNELTALANDIFETIFQGIRSHPQEPGVVLKLQQEDSRS